MYYEKSEIVKELEYCIAIPGKEPLLVKAKIIKHEKSGYAVRLSHIYRRAEGDANYYSPGSALFSVNDAEKRLDEYIGDFTLDYIPNKDY